MKRIPNWIIIVLVLALLIVLKFMFFPKEDGGGAKPGAGKEQPPVAANYFVVKNGDFENDVFTAGKIGAYNEVDLVPEVSGKVAAIYFSEGESVEKGALLVKLNDADLQAQALKIKSQLALAQQKLKRLEQLLKINGISQEEFDLQHNEVESLKADEAYSAALIAKTNIVAPFSGQAGLKNCSVGSYVTNQTPIVSLLQMKPVYVEFSIPEKYSSLFKKGDQISFKTAATESGEQLVATVYAIEPRVDESTRSIKARARYTGDKVLYPGSFVNVYVDLGKTDNALLVPTQAVTSVLKGHKVYVTKAGAAIEVPVKVGLRTDAFVQITEGLSAGDTILTTGLLSIRKDSKIKLITSK